MSRDDIYKTLSGLKSSIWDGWFRNADRSYKPKIAEFIRSPEARNAGMNLFHQEYQVSTGREIPFDQFMETPIKMYRGGGSPSDETFTSYSVNRRTAENFAASKGQDPSSISVIEMKPKDTLGAFNPIAEGEVLIPSWEGKDFMGGDPAFRGRSNHELRTRMKNMQKAGQDPSRLAELKPQHAALRQELKVRDASGHQSRNPYEVDHSQQTSDEDLEDERAWNSHKLGSAHRDAGLPRNPDHPDVQHKEGYEDGYSSQENYKGPFSQASWDAGNAAADAGEFADPRNPDVEDPHVYLSGYRSSMDKRPDPRTDDPNYEYTPATDDNYDVKPDDHIQLLIDRWQRDGQRPSHRTPSMMVPVHELLPHREYIRNPEHSRGGAEHWHQLKQKMANEGWDPEDPLILRVGREGGVKVGEGNHRLAISKELGVDKVPVHVYYSVERVKKFAQSTNRPIPPENPPRDEDDDDDDDPFIKELMGLI